MKRIIYTLFASALFMPLAYAQTEAVQKEVEGLSKSMRAEGAELKKVLEEHPDVRIAKIKVQLADEERLKIERSLAALKQSPDNNPDVRLARLKVELAMEQLRQTQHELTKKYTDLKLLIKIQKEKTDYFSAIVERNTETKTAMAPFEKWPAEYKLIELKAELAKLEAEFQSLIGGNPKTEEKDSSVRLYKNDQVKIESAKTLGKIEPGSTLDKFKSIIDKPIEFSCKQKPASEVLKELNGKTGSNVIVRMGDLDMVNAPLSINHEGKMTLSSWIEMILDDCNSQIATMNPINGQKVVFDAYVRDYGILISFTFKRPQDAMTLREFTALVRAEKAKTEPKK